MFLIKIKKNNIYIKSSFMALEDKISTMVATSLRDRGLNDILNSKEITDDVIKKIKEYESKEDKETITELENPAIANGPTEFPEEDDRYENVLPPEGFVKTDKIVPGEKVEIASDSINTPINEIPDFLKDVEPGKIIIFDENELSEGGENLSNKPFKTYDDPDTKESINQMWSEKGITKVEVFRAKFERIGDLEYDYKNGTTKFVRLNEQPLQDKNGVYKENPYKTESNPVMADANNVENYLKNNIDLDQKVNDVITNIVKDYFMTNSEKAQMKTPELENNIEVDDVNLNESISLEDIIGINTKFEKVDTPVELLEAIENNDKTNLLFENDEIIQYQLNDKKYIFLTNSMSLKKCYTK